VLMNESRTVRRILDLVSLDPPAWVFDGHEPSPDRAQP
jgi:hypothetical protein